ncbi:hypothetical protein PDE_02088 [Penicillium oxalicum 114-2]|uniref:Mitochondrial export protein Som1 n=1 Tax=Penicillium oxalicum (strain 114-2 / CGMCC 5302) TaxID=933388 RepID=S7Z950_PENO1|nr:hypothetical protein PDE_02088 [Penicillium oxalicum 114-2]
MAPVTPKFHVSALPVNVKIVERNFTEPRPRKGPSVKLDECPLYEMVQYSCNPPSDNIPEPGRITCQPIVRLFRRCAKGLMVETTSWEPTKTAARVARHQQQKDSKS